MILAPHNKHIKLIRLRALRMIRGSGAGDYISQRASSTGFEFDSLRLYEQGDDVRRIDWNSSVRVGSLMVRSFHEQHNRTIILMLDISRSMYSGSYDELKCHLMQVVARSISLAASTARDAIGVCLTMNERIIDYVAPRAGRSHAMHCMGVIEKALNKLESQEHSNDSELHITFPRHAWLILMTDGLVPGYAAWWRALAVRNVVTIVRIRDRYEKNIPTGFSIACYDPERPQARMRYTLRKSLQNDVSEWYHNQFLYSQKIGASLVDLIAGEPYEEIVRNFFERGIKTKQ